MKKLLGFSALVLTLTLPPTAQAHEDGGGDLMMQSSPNAAKAPYDIQYLDTMAEHHREGIRMFQMAVDKAKSGELRDKAQRMVDDQEKEIPVLTSMREDVKPDAPAAVNMKFPGMKPMDMSRLESASGGEFDRRFLDMTIKHHQGAVEMSKAELKSGKYPQAKDKAHETIDKQVKEIAELKRMRDTLDR